MDAHESVVIFFYSCFERAQNASAATVLLV
jgi:hypothetical protein